MFNAKLLNIVTALKVTRLVRAKMRKFSGYPTNVKPSHLKNINFDDGFYILEGIRSEYNQQNIPIKDKEKSDIIKLVSSIPLCEHFGVGNCGENACLAALMIYEELQSAGKDDFSVHIIDPGPEIDHNFVLVKLSNNKNIIIDPLSNVPPIFEKDIDSPFDRCRNEWEGAEIDDQILSIYEHAKSSTQGKVLNINRYLEKGKQAFTQETSRDEIKSPENCSYSPEDIPVVSPRLKNQKNTNSKNDEIFNQLMRVWSEII